MFKICTKHRSLVLQTTERDDVLDWLNALDPLLIGTIKYLVFV